LFIVTESEEPFQTQVMTANDADISQMRDDYLKLRYECWEWLQDGKPNPGWLPQKTLKYWRKDGK